MEPTISRRRHRRAAQAALKAGLATATLALVLDAVPWAPALATAITWQSGQGNPTSWDKKQNWDSNTVPTSADTVAIPSVAAVPSQPTVSGSTDAALSVAVAGTLTVSGPGALLAIGSGGLSGTGSVITQSGGALTLSGATNSIATLTDNGTVTLGTNNSLTVGTGLSGSGSLTTSGTGTLTLSGATNSIGTLTDGGKLALGSNTLTVSSDYNNTSSGTGNSFNKHANVTGAAPHINAAGTTSEQVGGTAVTGGTTAAPTLALGNIHVGASTTQNYQIKDVGTGGPSLRGAIQTTVSGGNLTDSRLSGTGVTAGNWGPVAQGASSSNLAVTFNATTAGALTGQAVHIANNFDNVAEQTLSITGAAYNLAAGTVNTTQPVNLGNFHVGGSTASQGISITNSASSGAFSEKLDASVSGTAGGATSGGGGVSLLAAGSTNTTGITAAIGGSTDGVKNGSLTLGLTSDGTGTSGLGNTALTSQTVNVTGTGYNFAVAQVNGGGTTLNLGTFHVGGSASGSLNVANTAPNDGFSEKLDASVSSSSGVTATGSVGLLAAESNSNAISVGIGGASAGVQSGSVTLGLTSDGTGTSGLGNTALASQTVNVTGAAYNLAAATVNNAPIDFSIVHVGETASRAVSISNTAPTGAYTEGLDAAITGASGNATGSGSVGLLAAGQTDNSSLSVKLETATAGMKSGSVSLGLKSDGAGTSGLGMTGLDPQAVQVKGQVNNYASAALGKVGGDGSFSSLGTTYTLDFGLVKQGSGLDLGVLDVLNAAETLADTLHGTFSILSGAGLFGVGDFATVDGLGAGQSSGPLTVSFDPLNTGNFTETLGFTWYGYNAAGYQDAIPQYLTLALTADVEQVPEPATAAIVGSGLLGILATLRRRRRRTTA